MTPRGFAVRCITLLALAALPLVIPPPPPAAAVSQPSTFSIVAYDSLTQEVGVAVQSRYFSVGMAVPWADALAGAVATQANVNVSLGPRALALLKSGMSPEEVIQALSATDSLWSSRQFALVDTRGRAATWTGKKCMDYAGGQTGPGFAVQGNILAGPGVVEGMANAMRKTKGELAERLISALEAAQAAGGDKRGMQSASLLIVRPSKTHPEYNTRYVDLRVEDHKTPIRELRRVWQIHEGFHMTNAHLNFAKEYDAAGRSDLARVERERVGESLSRALARGERDASLLNGMAWTLAIHDLYLPDALRAAERASSIEPRDVDILDTLAEVHFRLGNVDKAVEVETKASKIDPKNNYLKEQIARFKAGKK